MAKKNKPLYIRVDNEMHACLLAISKKRKEPMAEIARRILYNGLNSESAVDGLDTVTEAARKALKSVLTPQIERLAKISVKAALDSGTAMYMLCQVMEDMKITDVDEYFDNARKKVVAKLKERDI